MANCMLVAGIDYQKTGNSARDGFRGSLIKVFAKINEAGQCLSHPCDVLIADAEL